VQKSNTGEPFKPIFHLNRVDRLNNLSDGIFAFSMTLLILSVPLPSLPQAVTNDELARQIGSYWRQVVTYVISFLNIGGYWLLHQTVFSDICQANKPLAMLNMVFLLTVTFLPYPTALLGVYGKQETVALIYGGTIIVNYTLLFLVAWYAYSRAELINPDYNFPIKTILKARLTLALGLALIGTIMSFFFVRFSFVFFFLVPLCNAIPVNGLIRAQKNQP
jgi:uncharacterized membrane protein